MLQKGDSLTAKMAEKLRAEVKYDVIYPGAPGTSQKNGVALSLPKTGIFGKVGHRYEVYF